MTDRVVRKAGPGEAFDMRGQAATGLILAALISLLAIADGVLHVMLDFILFHGSLWGSPHLGPPPAAPASGPGGYAAPVGPPPGAPAPPHLPLPLNELFLLNCVGFVALVIALWLTRRWLTAWASLVDLGLIAMAAASIAGWFYFGEPNPNGLGYLSKAIEIVLIVLLLLNLRGLIATRARMGAHGGAAA